MADKLLTNGQFLTSNTVLFTANTITGIKGMLFHNTGTTNQYIKLYLNGSAESNKILDIYIVPLETIVWAVEYPLMLENTNTLRGKSDANSTVNYFIYGRDEA